MMMAPMVTSNGTLPSSSNGSQAHVAHPSAPHSNLYVKNLPLEADEGLLLEIFGQYGTIESVRIFRSQQHPGKAPFAFVKFSSVHEAQAAIAHVNGAQFGSVMLEVKFADADAGASNPERAPPPSDNLYVKNLPSSYGEDELRQLFGPFGSVTMCRMLHQGDQTGQGGAAMVRMSTIEEAMRACASLQGQQVLGALQPLVVRFADTAEIKARKQAKHQGMAGVSAVASASNSFMAQQAFRFGGYYPGSNSSVSNGSNGNLLLSPQNGGLMPSGIGYRGANSSLAPGLQTQQLMTSNMGVFGSHGDANPGLQYDSMGYAAPNRMNGNNLTNGISTMGMGANRPANLAGAGGPASLYVKNLPTDADKLYLYEKFCPFGAVLSVKLLMDENGASKGVGFVNFMDPVSAAKAVAALHNLPVGDRNLHVAFQTHRSGK